ncbi:pyridoxamine 5'-phosphate oxidase family protein [Nonomuraea sp. NPDC049129]|uniref:pyridoxamine 5'-phosphate oxidase family protein n=1 Tax=Nonomuraea sp. NPDC049129 TaxID=3155272 RepID=UPI0033F0F34C
MKLDSAGLQVLSHEECMRLLPTRPIGRIVFTDSALPAVQPVNFCLDGEDIVIRTAAGSKLAAATRHAVVASRWTTSTQWSARAGRSPSWGWLV